MTNEDRLGELTRGMQVKTILYWITTTLTALETPAGGAVDPTHGRTNVFNGCNPPAFSPSLAVAFLRLSLHGMEATVSAQWASNRASRWDVKISEFRRVHDVHLGGRRSGRQAARMWVRAKEIGSPVLSPVRLGLRPSANRKCPCSC